MYVLHLCMCLPLYLHHLDTITGLMGLLPAEMLEGADGEFELDFERLDNATLLKIDRFLRDLGLGSRVAASPSMVSHNPSVRLDNDEDDDDDGDFEDSDSD